MATRPGIAMALRRAPSPRQNPGPPATQAGALWEVAGIPAWRGLLSKA